jgi:biotin-dependent carboxylase-like uncharacterized protein
MARLGVPRAGAADPWARRAANRLVGNADDAGVIEVTVQGPLLRLGSAAYLAVIGDAEVLIDGRPIPTNVVVPATAGQTCTVRAVRGSARAYVAVDGGFEVPTAFGSRSSDLLCGLGVGPLVIGDVVGLGAPARPRGRWSGPDWGRRGVVRVMAGPDDHGPSLERMIEADWVVSADSDRIGVRLTADAPLDPPRSEIDSRGVVTGAVQVTQDGSAIALLCDHATVGGYPVIAAVISADIGELARCRPGDHLRIELVDGAEANAARVAAEHDLRTGVTGWYPVRAG